MIPEEEVGQFTISAHCVNRVLCKKTGTEDQEFASHFFIGRQNMVQWE